MHQLRSTAFHEAGHAVMAYLLRVPFTSISIMPDAETLGRVVLGESPVWASPDSSKYNERAASIWFQVRTRVAMAGQIAEAHHVGRRLRFGMHADNANAADFALYLCRGAQDTADALLEWLYLDTRDRLVSPLVWPAVEELAAVLMERKMLRNRPAREVIRAALLGGKGKAR